MLAAPAVECVSDVLNYAGVLSDANARRLSQWGTFALHTTLQLYLRQQREQRLARIEARLTFLDDGLAST